MVFGGIYFLINLPLSYYSGFMLPHRFGMSNESVSDWVGDQLKSLAMGVVLGGILIEVVYAVLRISPEWWWLWVAGILLIFSVLLANLAPVLLMPLFYKFVPLGDEHADLVERLLRLAERAHTHVQGVFTVRSQPPHESRQRGSDRAGQYPSHHSWGYPALRVHA